MKTKVLIMFRFTFLCSLFFCVLTASSQDLTPNQLAELKTVKSESSMLLFMDGNPNLNCQVAFINSFDNKAGVDSLIYQLDLEGTQKIDNGDGNMSYFKLFQSSTETEYRVRTIFLDGTKLEVEKINALQIEILTRLNAGESFEKLYEEFNMDDRQQYGDLGWVRPEALLEPFTSLVKIQETRNFYEVDIPYLNWYYIAQNISEPTEQTRNKYLKINLKK